jgi:hypothetical protein
MAASLAAVEAAQAALDDDPATARRCWSQVLSAVVPHEYLLLVCDALEGLGCLAARDADTARAGLLLSTARQCRADITYQHRFRYEQELLEQARASLQPAADSVPPLPWQEAVAVALKP